jgi:hypothetical protein
MRKLGIVLTAAAVFDLGTVVVSSQAADTIYMKVEITEGRNVGAPASADHKSGKANTIFKFFKIDAVNTPQACMAKGGTVVSKNGQQACKSQQAIRGWIEVLSF